MAVKPQVDSGVVNRRIETNDVDEFVRDSQTAIELMGQDMVTDDNIMFLVAALSFLTENSPDNPSIDLIKSSLSEVGEVRIIEAIDADEPQVNEIAELLQETDIITDSADFVEAHEFFSSAKAAQDAAQQRINDAFEVVEGVVQGEDRPEAEQQEAEPGSLNQRFSEGAYPPGGLDGRGEELPPETQQQAPETEVPTQRFPEGAYPPGGLDGRGEELPPTQEQQQPSAQGDVPCAGNPFYIPDEVTDQGLRDQLNALDFEAVNSELLNIFERRQNGDYTIEDAAFSVAAYNMVEANPQAFDAFQNTSPDQSHALENAFLIMKGSESQHSGLMRRLYNETNNFDGSADLQCEPEGSVEGVLPEEEAQQSREPEVAEPEQRFPEGAHPPGGLDGRGEELPPEAEQQDPEVEQAPDTEQEPPPEAEEQAPETEQEAPEVEQEQPEPELEQQEAEPEPVDPLLNPDEILDVEELVDGKGVEPDGTYSDRNLLQDAIDKVREITGDDSAYADLESRIQDGNVFVQSADSVAALQAYGAAYRSAVSDGQPLTRSEYGAMLGAMLDTIEGSTDSVVPDRAGVADDVKAYDRSQQSVVQNDVATIKTNMGA